MTDLIKMLQRYVDAYQLLLKAKELGVFNGTANLHNRVMFNREVEDFFLQH